MKPPGYTLCEAPPRWPPTWGPAPRGPTLTRPWCVVGGAGRYGDAVPRPRRRPGAPARGWRVARRSTPMRETAVDLHALVQAAGDAIIVADVHGRIVLWN